MRPGLLRFMPSSARACLALWASVGSLGLACEPDWSALTSERGAGGRGGSVSGSSGSVAESGTSGTSDGGVPSSGGTGTTAGGEPTEMGGEPAAAGAGEGGSPPVDDGAIDLPGTATADSEETAKNNIAAHGHDDDVTTKWVAADGDLDHYWTLDLAEVHRLARVKIKWEYPSVATPDTVYGYTVSVSDDGSTWREAIDKRDNKETTPDQVAEMPSATSGRYVRITVTGLAAGCWASFFEAHVFGFPTMP